MWVYFEGINATANIKTAKLILHAAKRPKIKSAKTYRYTVFEWSKVKNMFTAQNSP